MRRVCINGRTIRSLAGAGRRPYRRKTATAPVRSGQRDQPEDRVAERFGGELLLCRVDGHIEVRASDRHLPQIPPKDQNALLGPQLDGTQRLGAAAPTDLTCPAFRVLRTQLVTP